MKIFRGQLKVAVPGSKFYSAPLHDKRFFWDSFGIYSRLELEMGLLIKNVTDNYEILESCGKNVIYQLCQLYLFLRRNHKKETG